MWNSIQEEADLYRERLHNTWNLPKQHTQDGIASPWSSLNKLITEFQPGECYVFGGSSAYSCLDTFRAYLLWYFARQSIPMEIRGGKENDFEQMIVLESGFSAYSIAHRTNQSQRQEICEMIEEFRQKPIEWFPMDACLSDEKTQIYFFSLSLNTWQDHCFTFSRIAKEKNVLCFVFVYLNIQERSQYKNPYYLTLDVFRGAGIRAFHKDYADYMGVVYPYVPIIHKQDISVSKMDPSMVVYISDTKRIDHAIYYLGEDSKQHLMECDITVF